MLVIGLDPGKSFGFAAYQHKKLVQLETYCLVGVLGVLRHLTGNDLVIIEDSRLQSVLFPRINARGVGVNHKTQLKIARDVGRIDSYCDIVQEFCVSSAIPLIKISPEQKGKKLDAEAFAKKTGWEGKTNQHVRDAAIVAWPFRNGAKMQQQLLNAAFKPESVPLL
jgi:hypothetical protein